MVAELTGTMAEEIKQSNILIVDDNTANVALLEDILENAGYDEFTSTTDPRTVLPLCQEEEFDLILLDIRMPHMSGLEVMEVLSKHFPADHYLPILVLTAQLDQQTRQQALALGAKDFLTKPFQHWEALLRIQNQLETRYFYKRQIVRGDLLEREVAKRTEEIRSVQLEVVKRLGMAGEFRDNETGAHVVRMSRISEVIARGAGLDEKMCELILHSSTMHDVGKIGVPDRVLLKAGKLDDEEWAVMKSHVEIGSTIIGDYPADILWMAGVIAEGHHEKWDGSGYPQGLKGEAIPIAARIAAISDVFDALLSVRPYKEAWPLEKALAVMKESSGRHFDPNLLDVFFDKLDEILEIRQALPD